MAKKTKQKKVNKKTKKNDENKNNESSQMIKTLDPKASIDIYFSDRKNYHLYQDTKTKNPSYFSSTLKKIDSKSSKFYNIQLLEHDTKKDLKLFTRWGRIDTKGNQEIKSVNQSSGPKIFIKKYNEKLKKGYFEEFTGPIIEDNLSDKSEKVDVKVEKIIDAIKRISKTDSYKIIVEKSNPGILDSKFGGLPYWPKNKEYPTNLSKQKLTLLVQINFEKEKTEYPLPKEGILQIFILDNNDNCYGANFNGDLTEQNNFRIVYHDKIDYSISKEQIKKLKVPIHADSKNDFPVKKECKISLKKCDDYITYEDFRFNDFFAKAYKEIYKKNLPKDLGAEYVLEFEDNDIIIEELTPDEGNHKMLGYPYFCQEDPRRNNYEVYDTVLLQIDSQQDILMWGDCGCANFLIKKKDLIKNNFSDVLFNWDCH